MPPPATEGDIEDEIGSTQYPTVFGMRRTDMKRPTDSIRIATSSDQRAEATAARASRKDKTNLVCVGCGEGRLLRLIAAVCGVPGGQGGHGQASPATEIVDQ